jgi:hypothetical protein
MAPDAELLPFYTVDPLLQNDSNFMSSKKLLDGTTFLFSDGFDLSPFGFNVIKVWGIGRQVFKRMPSIGNGCFDILPFMECRIIHDDHANPDPKPF